MNKYEELTILKDKKSACIITHVKVDTDGLSSSVVLKKFLERYFNIERVDIFTDTDNIPENYQQIIDDINLNPEPIEYDVAIMIDSAKTDRLGKYEDLFLKTKLKINIDHHSTNTKPADINIVELSSSACEIVYKILSAYNFELSANSQGKLYAGIITDTNNFTVGNFNNETFDVCSKIINNVNNEAIYNHFLANYSLKNMKLFAKAIDNITNHNNDQIIISHITKEELDLLNANSSDLMGVINRLATISHSKLVCLIYPFNENEYYVSMRAKQGYDVAVIAKKYNGGGHIGAAAFNSDKKINEIESIILNEFKNQIQNSGNKKSQIF